MIWIGILIEAGRAGAIPYPWGRNDKLTDINKLLHLARSSFYDFDGLCIVTADTESQAERLALETFKRREMVDPLQRNNSKGNMIITEGSGYLRDLNIETIEQFMQEANGIQAYAASALGISKRRMNYLIANTPELRHWKPRKAQKV